MKLILFLLVGTLLVLQDVEAQQLSVTTAIRQFFTGMANVLQGRPWRTPITSSSAQSIQSTSTMTSVEVLPVTTTTFTTTVIVENVRIVTKKEQKIVGIVDGTAIPIPAEEIAIEWEAPEEPETVIMSTILEKFTEQSWMTQTVTTLQKMTKCPVCLLTISPEEFSSLTGQPYPEYFRMDVNNNIEPTAVLDSSVPSQTVAAEIESSR